MANGEEIFLQSPLAAWVKTFYDDDGKPLDFKQLCDGVFLHTVWLQIDAHPMYSGVINPATDMTARLRNLNMLLHNIKVFYEEVLEQVLVMHLPNVVSIAKATFDESSEQELSRLLLLMLGCAVQCGRKGRFIEAIRRLDLATQASLAEAIASITDNPDSVWTRDWGRLETLPEADRPRMYATLVRHVATLSRQRDSAAQRLVNLTLEQESSGSSDSPGDQVWGGSDAPSPQAADSRLGVELADTKAKLRRCQQELEEKLEVLSEQKEELSQLKEAIARLRQENLELVQDARTAKAYRDEIDILKEKVLKLDRLESEIQRYKDKMSELDFFRSRVEELREDKRILGETKAMLEEQLEGSRRRVEHAVQLEAQLLKARARLSECTLERDLDRSQVQKLLEQNAQLRLEHQATLDENVQLQGELQRLRAQATSPRTENSLLEQLNTDAETRALHFELENRRLQVLLDEMKAQVEESPTKSELQAQCALANERLEQLEQENATKEQQHETDRHRIAGLESEKAELQRQLEISKNECAKIEELEKAALASNLEAQRLQKALDASQSRLSTCRTELQAAEAENAKLQSTLESLKSQLQRMHSIELEGADLETWLHRAEQERRSLDREASRLRSSLQAKDQSLDELSSRVSALERENEQLRKEAQKAAASAAHIQDLEHRCQELSQKASLEAKALSDLRQELVEEKLRNEQLTSELDRIATSLELTTSLWKTQRENSRETQESPRESTFTPLFCLEKTKAVLEEVENLSSVSAEDKRSKADREAVLPKSTELIECVPELSNSVERDKLISKKVLELKESILALEKKNGCLEEEAWRLRSQLQALQEHTASLQGRATSGEQRHLGLQAQHAQLQVEAAYLGSQHTALQQKVSELQEQLLKVEAQRDQLSVEKTELAQSKEALMRDHQVLEKLHEQLSADYQALASNLSCVKASCKLLKQENASLKEELSAARQAEEKLRAEFEALKTQHRALKESHSNLRSDHSRLRGDLEESRSDLVAARVDLSRLVASYEASLQVLAQAQGELQEERRRLLSGISSLLSRCRNVLPESSLPGIQEDRVLLRELESLRDDLEGRLRDYARKLDGNLSLSKESLSKSRSGYLSCNVTQMNDVLSVPIGSIGNGLCSQGRFQSEYSDYNGRNPWGSTPQDDQIPVRDVGPLAQSSRCHGSSPESSLTHFSNSCVLQDAPPTCSTPLSTPKQQSSSLPAPAPHVTVENHTTVNLVTHVNATETAATPPASAAQPHTSTPHGFSRTPALRHSMYSRLRGSGVGNSPGLRAPLRLCTSQEKLLLDDGTDFDASQSSTDHANQPGSREKRANAVWVVNQWGPMTKLMRPTTSHNQSPVKQEHQPTVPEGIEERLRNMESHLKLKSGCAVPHDVYARLKQLEDRILYLEGISPDYFSTPVYSASPAKRSHSNDASRQYEDWSLAQIESRIDLLKSRLREKAEATSEPSTSSMAL
ncbi:hypothetical protein HPB50_024353 [Hyalomma asiaticum]|uniref:Uncharacterized protein n=1 Tax=Hyalomma asiaticum TaxID=266040 RepID=A0ACB7RWX7_HYAAI|nr:hypothetical protein HPB50_024353 [Hyalomma asiaticum]